MDYITKKLSGCPGSTIAKDLKDVVRFLEWKRTERPECFTEIEHSLMEEQKRNLSRLVYLSSNCYSYDRSLIAKYSEILWQESINNTLSLEGKANIPKVSCEPLPIPPDFSRLDEVLYMSLFYENICFMYIVYVQFMYRVLHSLFYENICMFYEYNVPFSLATKPGRIAPMPMHGRYSDCRTHFV